MPESIVVLRRFIAIANLFAFVLPASAAPPLPEEFGGVFWGSMPALVPGPEGYIPGRYIHESGRGRDPGRADGGMPLPPLPQMLRGLALTETQQDKVFGILHAQAPALRAATKTARNMHDELSALANSERYDATKAKALADAEARATSEVTLLRAQSHHQIFMTLTPEQRESLELARRAGARP